MAWNFYQSDYRGLTQAFLYRMQFFIPLFHFRQLVIRDLHIMHLCILSNFEDVTCQRPYKNYQLAGFLFFSPLFFFLISKSTLMRSYRNLGKSDYIEMDLTEILQISHIVGTHVAKKKKNPHLPRLCLICINSVNRLLDT